MNPGDYPAKARIAAESATGPATALLRAQAAGSKAAQALIEALAGSKQATFLVEVLADGTARISADVQEIQTAAERIETRANTVATTAITSHLSADKAGALLGELVAMVSRVAKLAFGQLALTAITMLLSAERRLEIKSRTVKIRTDGGSASIEASSCDIDAPNGHLGGHGLPLVTQRFAPFVIDSRGQTCPVQGLQAARWRAQ